MKLFELLEVTHISPNNIIIEKDNEFCCTLQYASTNIKGFNFFRLLRQKISTKSIRYS